MAVVGEAVIEIRADVSPIRTRTEGEVARAIAPAAKKIETSFERAGEAGAKLVDDALAKGLKFDITGRLRDSQGKLMSWAQLAADEAGTTLARGIEDGASTLDLKDVASAAKREALRRSVEQLGEAVGDAFARAAETQARVDLGSTIDGQRDELVRAAENTGEATGRAGGNATERAWENALEGVVSSARTAGDRAGNAFGEAAEDEIRQSADAVDGAFNEHIGGRLRGSAIAIGSAIGGALAAAGIGALASQAVQSASAVDESTSKVNVVFGESADSVLAFADTAATALGQTEGQALEAAGTFGNLLRAVGLNEEQAAKFSTSMVGLASDLASFNNTDPAEALDALRSGLTGETEPLKRFGINMNDATLTAKALELGLLQGSVAADDLAASQEKVRRAEQNLAAAQASGDQEKITRATFDLEQANAKLAETLEGKVPAALDANQKAQAAYALIMEQTALAQGDFERTSGGLANQQRIMAAGWGDLQASIGKALLPSVMKVIDVLNEDLMPQVGGILETLTPVLTSVIEKVLPALQPVGALLSRVFETAGPVIETVAETLGVLLPPLARVADAVLKALGPPVQRIMQTFGKIVDALSPVFQRMAPFIEKIVGLLGDSLATAIDHLMDGIEPMIPIFIELQERVFKALEPVLPQLADALGKMAVALADLLVALLPLLIPLLEFQVMLIEKIGAPVLVLIAEALANVAENVALVATTIKPIVEWLGGVLDSFVNFVGTLLAPIEGFVNGVIDFFAKLPQKVGEFIQTVVDLITGLPGRIVGLVNDLKEAAVDLGAAIIEGIMDGLAAAADFVGDIAKEIVNGIIGFINQHVIGGINDLLEFDVPLPFGKKFTVDPPDLPDIPKLAQGALVSARAGGTLALVAERGVDEAVIPLPRGLLAGLEAIASGAALSSGDTTTVNIGTLVSPKTEETPRTIARGMRNARWLLGV